MSGECSHGKMSNSVREGKTGIKKFKPARQWKIQSIEARHHNPLPKEKLMEAIKSDREHPALDRDKEIVELCATDKGLIQEASTSRKESCEHGKRGRKKEQPK